MKKLYSVLFAIALALGITPANAQKISALPDAGLAQAGDLFPISNLGRSATTSFTVTAQNLMSAGLPATFGATVISAGVMTTAVPALSAAQTWNNAGTTFTGLRYTVTPTARADGSKYFAINDSLGDVFSIKVSDAVKNTQVFLQTGGGGGQTLTIESRNASTGAGAIYANGSMQIGTTATLTTLLGIVTLEKTITAGGTTGAQTINKNSGSVNFAAAATSLVWTNSLVSTSSVITCTAATNDATAYVKNVVAAAGSFTITLGAAATAETRVNCIIL